MKTTTKTIGCRLCKRQVPVGASNAVSAYKWHLRQYHKDKVEKFKQYLGEDYAPPPEADYFKSELPKEFRGLTTADPDY